MRRFLIGESLRGVGCEGRFSSVDVDQTDDNRVPDEAGNVVNIEAIHQLGTVSFHGFYADF